MSKVIGLSPLVNSVFIDSSDNILLYPLERIKQFQYALNIPRTESDLRKEALLEPIRLRNEYVEKLSTHLLNTYSLIGYNRRTLNISLYPQGNITEDDVSYGIYSCLMTTLIAKGNADFNRVYRVKFNYDEYVNITSEYDTPEDTALMMAKICRNRAIVYYKSEKRSSCQN